LIGHTLRRLAQALPTAWLVATLVFTLLHLIPGDPVEAMLGDRAQVSDVVALRHSLGLDRPLVEQYVRYLNGLVHGDLGASLRSRASVASLLAQRWPATLELAAASLILALAVAIPLGVLAATRRGAPADRVVRWAALLGTSLPSLWLGPLLILLFGVGLDWLPISGRAGTASIILPALTLSCGIAALLMRMVRAAVSEELAKPYVLAARARGVSRSRAVWLHALRNALLPILTVLGLQCGALLAGAVVVETVFSWPGLGRLLVEAIQWRDYPVVQGAVLLIALSYVLVNLMTDLLCAWADPRMRQT